MARSERLLELIQVLRRHRRPVSGAVLAEELGVSLRTVYRDIDTLKAQGAHIDGEAGMGYVLRPGFMLPPLMFSEEEIEALVLGSRWVHQRGDRMLAAWCEMRQDFRHFRTDRIATLTETAQRYPRRRRALMREWRTREGIPEH